jgi:hypothetical protein
MQKRKLIIGDYDTAAFGWTLAAWKLADPTQKTKYEDKPSGDGSWDLSTALTDGIPRYTDRELIVTLELSEGTRLEREEIIRYMVNLLDGLRWPIYLPDDDLHYITGRVHVAREYNDPTHAAVTVTAICEPWKYANTETVVTLTATSTARSTTLYNSGRRAVVPTLTVTGSVVLGFGASTLSLSAGTYTWPDLLLTTGRHVLTYSGSGTVVLTYREAVLE